MLIELGLTLIRIQRERWRRTEERRGEEEKEQEEEKREKYRDGEMRIF